MINNLRIWRVVPTHVSGMQAPSFLVETTESVLEKAQGEALKKAKIESGLSRFATWYFEVEKLKVRKDEFGRYLPYHQ